MEVAPFFVDFHHFLSIFTIFYRFTHFCRDLHFVAIYAFLPQFFLAKIAFSATSHFFCMYALTIPCLTKMCKISNGICFFLPEILKGLGPSVSSIYAPRLHFQEGPHWSWSWLSLFPRKEQLTGKSHKSRLGKFDAQRLQVITMFPLQRIPQKMMRTFSVFEGIFPVSSNLSPNLGIHQWKHGTLSADLWSRNWNL